MKRQNDLADRHQRRNIPDRPPQTERHPVRRFKNAPLPPQGRQNTSGEATHAEHESEAVGHRFHHGIGPARQDAKTAEQPQQHIENGRRRNGRQQDAAQPGESPVKPCGLLKKPGIALEME